MKTAYTTSLYSTEITRKAMHDIILASKVNGIIDRGKFNRALQDAVLMDECPDMGEKEYPTLTAASNATNHKGDAYYFTNTVPGFHLSARAIEGWTYEDDDDVPESNGVIEIDDFEDDVIDRILNEYPSEC